MKGSERRKLPLFRFEDTDHSVSIELYRRVGCFGLLYAVMSSERKQQRRGFGTCLPSHMSELATLSISAMTVFLILIAYAGHAFGNLRVCSATSCVVVQFIVSMDVRTV